MNVLMMVQYAYFLFFAIALVVVPLFLGCLCRWLMPRRWWKLAAFACTLLIYGTVAYGTLVGYEQLEVRHVDFESSDVPEAFDGFRIALFSDAHVGTMENLHSDLFVRAIDSINAQHPDVVLFAGDMVNLRPDEFLPFCHLLDRFDSKHGVYTVLGNHDYSIYLGLSKAKKKQRRQRIIELENRGRTTRVLTNEHAIIRRGNDSIVIAGMENWGKVKRMPRRGDVGKTLDGLTVQTSDLKHQTSPFIVMLQHDPTCWREKILPECHAQLTLSGHTHGGQFALFGLSPVSFAYDEWNGLYTEGDRALYVTAGLGGLIPFRLGQPGEVAIITLKVKNKK